ncbi:hypothetical protein JIG36_17455 [Actinoplanes sp. LDG1-06]|uniref:Uncharacterized protein n=1 Tax=Paractinoplanes ovalisporus TaxID=2810368 RepID=A0ABS2ADK6_9ACTN|nr:hypothetical protein [Actinoplanes ovalisporus]MBM2617344.1 hypothetical protein [Actinoplanes ovalisporus]
MAIGLPIAISIGWNLATPSERPAAVGAPGGSGALGAAPTSTSREPVAVRYSAQPRRPTPTVTASGTPSLQPIAPIAAPSLTTTAPTGSPSPTTPSATPTDDPFPPLTMPPVPTPTEISPTPPEEPPSSSAPGSEAPPTFP